MKAFLRSKSFWIPTVLCSLLFLFNMSTANESPVLTAGVILILSIGFAGFLFGGVLYVLIQKIKSAA